MSAVKMGNFHTRNIATKYLQNRLSYIPLIAPSTSLDRIRHLVTVADSFIYVVSTMGVTGARSNVNTLLPDLVARIRQYTDLPLAVGFGVTTRERKYLF